MCSQVLVAMMISHLAKSSDSMLPNELLKPVLTCLVNGTMEKNSMVKSCRFVSLYLNKSKKQNNLLLFIPVRLHLSMCST